MYEKAEIWFVKIRKGFLKRYTVVGVKFKKNG